MEEKVVVVYLEEGMICCKEVDASEIDEKRDACPECGSALYTVSQSGLPPYTWTCYNCQWRAPVVGDIPGTFESAIRKAGFTPLRDWEEAWKALEEHILSRKLATQEALALKDHLLAEMKHLKPK